LSFYIESELHICYGVPGMNQKSFILENYAAKSQLKFKHATGKKLQAMVVIRGEG
jgi:hypothetical protein